MRDAVQRALQGEYKTLFQVRGHSYDAAMQGCPDAREQEFRQLFVGVEHSALSKVLDIPSGGGYLQRYLPATCQLHSLDPCDNFRSIAGGQVIDLARVELPIIGYDTVVCLAALHHISNKEAFIGALWSSLASDGQLLIADVAAGSGEAAFLDQFASRYNQTGHRGEYLPGDNAPAYLSALPGACLRAYEIRDCFWRFADQSQLLWFCRSLFGLQSVSDAQLLTALQDYIGISRQQDTLQLHWRLLYLHCHKSVASDE